MKNIHIIPTDKPSRLIKQTNGKLRLSEITFKGQIASGVTQNIYITSEEPIKEGDRFIAKNKAMLCTQVTSTIIASNTSNGGAFSYSQSKKIILTTDQDLDGVQAIDNEFLEWFVKNPSCEEVEIFHQDVYSIGEWDRRYKIIIPKEEPKQEIKFEDVFNDEKKEGLKEFIDNHKQETLEECFLANIKNVLQFGNDAQAIRFMEKYFEAKQERSYIEEEVIDLLKALQIHYLTYNERVNIDKWFEQFKKK